MGQRYGMRSAGLSPQGRRVLAQAHIALLPDDLSRTRGRWSDLRRFVHTIAD